MLSYWNVCDEMVDAAADALDLLDSDSGFSWHKPTRSRVEQQIGAIRHIQHHTAQLATRVHVASGGSVEWVGSRHNPEPGAGE